MTVGAGRNHNPNHTITNIMTSAISRRTSPSPRSVPVSASAFVGSKAAEATGRNPGAATPILVASIIFAALIEGVFLITVFVVSK